MAGGVTVTIGGTDYSENADRLSRITIDRGRQDELDRVETGTASLDLAFTSGSIPDLIGDEVLISLYSNQIYGGIVDEMRYDLDPSQLVTRVQVDCVDWLDYIANIELAPDAGFGDTPPAGAEGNIFYEEETVQTRIEKALDEAGLTGYEVFTGNVRCRDTIYSPRTSLLTVINDAADAEFPGVANVYCPRQASIAEGVVSFHGRLARFNPDDSQYHITTFEAGDRAAWTGDTDKAPVRGLTLSRSRKHIINAALATPEGIADDDIAGQIYTDATSITAYGLRSWSAENLLTVYDILNDLEANDAVLLFANYYVDNYADPQTRVESVVFRSTNGWHPRDTANNTLISTIDISDILDLTVTNPGIAIASEFFVEGLHYDIRPMNGTHPDVTLSLDLSPRAYWTSDPFESE